MQTEEISSEANIKGRSLDVREEASDEDRTTLEVGQRVSDKVLVHDGQILVHDGQDQRPVSGKLSCRPATGLQN